MSLRGEAVSILNDDLQILNWSSMRWKIKLQLEVLVLLQHHCILIFVATVSKLPYCLWHQAWLKFVSFRVVSKREAGSESKFVVIWYYLNSEKWISAWGIACNPLLGCCSVVDTLVNSDLCIYGFKQCMVFENLIFRMFSSSWVMTKTWFLTSQISFGFRIVFLKNHFIMSCTDQSMIECNVNCQLWK